jgi:hypothetical protein
MNTSSVQAALGVAYHALTADPTLPKRSMMALLEIWYSANPKKLQQMAQSGELERRIRAMTTELDLALDIANENTHLAMHEALAAAGVSLRI